MAASVRLEERATSFAVACSLLSCGRCGRAQPRHKRSVSCEISAVVWILGALVTISFLPSLEAEEAERKETMELFPHNAGFGVRDAAAAPDASRKQEKKEKAQQLTIFYGGKVLVFNDFPADKSKGPDAAGQQGQPYGSERWFASASCTHNRHRQHEGPQGYADSGIIHRTSSPVP